MNSSGLVALERLVITQLRSFAHHIAEPQVAPCGLSLALLAQKYLHSASVVGSLTISAWPTIMKFSIARKRHFDEPLGTVGSFSSTSLATAGSAGPEVFFIKCQWEVYFCLK